MRRGDRWTRCVLGVASVLIVAGPLVHAEARIDVAVGIAGHVVRLHYVPIRVDLSGLRESVDGTIIVRQQIGNPIQDPDEIEHVLARELLTNRVYESTIPIYDPLNPLELSVVDGDGTILAEATVHVRMNRRTAPFPGVCGFSTEVTEDAVFLDAGDLPRDWWALDGLRSLWLGGDCDLTSSQWQTVAEWTMAGGSVVILTGADLYRLDSPILRGLLPIADPHLNAPAGGVPTVEGTLRDGAEIAMEGEDAAFVLLRGYGAGHVLMVTRAAGDLGEAEMRRIGALVPASRLLSAERVSEAALREMEVVRPSYLIAPAILVVTLGIFLWFARRVERRERVAWVALGLAVAGLSVWSGFVSNDMKRPVDLYRSTTVVSIQNSIGIDIGWHSLYSSKRRWVAVDEEEERFPIQSLVPGAAGTSFDAVSAPEGTRLRLEAHERRDLEFFGRETPLVEVRTADGVVTVENRSGAIIEGALVLSGGRVHRLPAIGRGENAFVLGDGEETYLYEAEDVAVEVVLERFSERLTLFSETWLVLFDEAESVRREGQLAEKVRDARIELICGETS